jgi:hypothetical protein
MAHYRRIVDRSTRRESDRSTPAHSRSRVWSWRAGTEVTTVTLSCGHTKDYRGDVHRVPKVKALCKQCP